MTQGTSSSSLPFPEKFEFYTDMIVSIERQDLAPQQRTGDVPRFTFVIEDFVTCRYQVTKLFSLSSGNCEVGAGTSIIFPVFNRRVKRSLVQILELVYNFRQVQRDSADASFLL